MADTKKIISVTILIAGLFVSIGILLFQGNTGTLVMKITDAPPELNIEKALITISNIEVHTANVENNVSESGWEIVSKEQKTFDLIAIKDIKEILGTAELTPGKYTQIRLNIENASAVIDGKENNLEIPSDKIKLIKNFDIISGETTTLVLDFDAKESIHSTGKDGYTLRPTIRILQE